MRTSLHVALALATVELILVEATTSSVGVDAVDFTSTREFHTWRAQPERAPDVAEHHAGAVLLLVRARGIRWRKDFGCLLLLILCLIEGFESSCAGACTIRHVG